MTNRKNDVKYHETLKQASISVYPNKGNKIPAGYKVIDRAENKKNGFYAEAISNGKDIVVVYRGTDIKPSTYEMILQWHSQVYQLKQLMP